MHWMESVEMGESVKSCQHCLIKAPKKVFFKNPLKSSDTHKASAQAEDGRVLALGVDVSAEKAVAHIAHVMEVRVRAVALLRSQVYHCVRGGDEVGVCGQIEMKAFPECINPVVNPQARQVIV